MTSIRGAALVLLLSAGQVAAQGWLPSGVRPRLSWGAAPAGAGTIAQTPRRVTVHHTETRPGPAEAQVATHLKGVQRFHQSEKKWPDIAYHVLIDPAGRAWEGRSLAMRGDSGTVYDLSDRALICLIGKFNEDRPTPEAWATLVRVIAEVCRKYGIATTEITMHRQLAQTDCPGNNVAAKVSDGTLKRDVDKYMAEHE